MWVTSNIEEWHKDQDSKSYYNPHTVASIALGFGEKKVPGGNETEREELGDTPNHSRKGRHVNGKQNGTNGHGARVRKWHWNEIVWKCAFPAGICYFFMAWAMLLSRELHRDQSYNSR
ncbi:4694_t:CDS:1 [Acaulospora colombiana]|uniref:4694_t:CDS:1 n=1 Tax=Acaulospora colombiana TaxID=27376 RepID=A0ACA9M4I1_9GLOM|nr:4694_t:CDS:1 [Acaulospora colombiana]